MPFDVQSAYTSQVKSGTKPRRQCCVFCPSSFEHKKQLLEHMKCNHGSEPKHQCQQCGVVVSTLASLRRHMLKHTGEQQFECKICFKKFTQKHHFKGHMNMHAGAKPYQCQQCLKCFTYSTQLTNHKKSCQDTTYN